jgi:hypothetical protein
MFNLDHVHFQHKTVIYFVQTFGNIYTIVPFCKHVLHVFHTIAWLILLRQISHLLNEDISWLVSSICEKYIMGKYFWSQLPMWIVRNFHNNLKIAIDKSITLVKMKDKFHTKSPWMTNGLFKSISKKDQLYKNF